MAVQAQVLLADSFESQIDDLLRRFGLSLQLDETHYNLADTSYRAVARYLENHQDVGVLNPNMYPQGSMRLNTTVKPLVGDEHDLDFVCEFARPIYYFDEPVAALNLIERALRGNRTYAPMVERKNRCIRLNYERQFHMDILPACQDFNRGGTCILIPDRKLGEWTASNPKGYAQWFESQSRRFAMDRMMEKAEPIPVQEPGQTKTSLKLCVQLLKRNRDVRYKDRPELAPVSITLTTLGAEMYRGEQSICRSMQTILSGMLNAIRTSRPGRLIVLNPMNRSEDLSERWDANPNAYHEFVGFVNDLDTCWKTLMETRSIDKVAKIFERLFGEQLVRKTVESYARDMESLRLKSALGIRKSSGLITLATGSSVVPIPRNTFFGDAK
jgi:hypothetical protein